MLTVHTSVCQKCLCLLLLGCRGRCDRALLEPLALLGDGDVVKRGLTLTDQLHRCCEHTKPTLPLIQLIWLLPLAQNMQVHLVRSNKSKIKPKRVIYCFWFHKSASNGTDSIFHHEPIYRLCTAFEYSQAELLPLTKTKLS